LAEKALDASEHRAIDDRLVLGGEHLASHKRVARVERIPQDAEHGVLRPCLGQTRATSLRRSTARPELLQDPHD
jgi:hypothetical protein